MFSTTKVNNQPKVEPLNNRHKIRLLKAIFTYILATAVIFLAAPYAAKSAADIAIMTKLGDTFIGTTLVALCTSLPELVSCIAALKIRSFDLAVGNIFGSNTFNILLAAPLDFASDKAILHVVESSHLFTCYSVIVASLISLVKRKQSGKKEFPIYSIPLILIFFSIAALFGIYLVTSYYSNQSGP